jgi:bifunctional DNA-binding transcriptional regulator/antitoxin component of YhaV-PrlF toxin-antitoxin module
MTQLFKKTKYARKVDAMGRITIPIRLREMTGIKIGDIYEYSIFEDGEKTYLCIECPEHAPED